MSDLLQREQRAPESLKPATRLLAGATMCSSGAALVVHIFTGSPLWLGLAIIGFAGAMAVAVAASTNPGAWSHLRQLAKRGVVVGLIGTAAYDLSRWMLVQLGGMELSPFEALPLFGQAILGEGATGPATEILGTGYHLINGVAFGVAYVVWFGRRKWWWGIIFALGLEAFMLAIYPGWLDPRSIAELTQVSLVGHVAYGSTLGLVATVARKRAA